MSIRSAIPFSSYFARRLPVHLDADIRAHDTTEGTFGAMLFVSIDTVMIARFVEILRHDEHAVGARLYAELAALTAITVDYYVVHVPLPFYSA
jgi:hypothetical protein